MSKGDGLMMIKRLLSSGFILMVLSAFFFAVSETIMKYRSPSMGTMQIAFVRSFLGLLILLHTMLAKGEPLKGGSIRILQVRGITGTMAFLCLLQCIAMIPLSNAIIIDHEIW